MPVGDFPIVEIIVRQLIAAGFTSVTLALGHLGGLIRAFFAAHKTLAREIDLQFVEEDQPTGTAGSLRLIPDLPETFLVVNGDVLTTLDFPRLIEFHRANNAWLTIAGHLKPVNLDVGVLRLQGAEVIDYVEKPKYVYPVSMGVYVYDRRAVTHIPPNSRFDLPELVLRLLAHQRKVACFESDALWLDIGRPEDYTAAQEMFERNQAQWRLAPPVPGAKLT